MKTVILERQETNKMSPLIGKLIAFIEFPTHGAAR